MASRNCPSCGNALTRGRAFCGNCGTPTPPAEPRKTISKKTIGTVIGSLIGVAALIGAYLVFFPAPLTAKDVSISLNLLDLPAGGEIWEGDSLKFQALVDLKEKRDSKYRVVIESKIPTDRDWKEVMDVEGEYPLIEAPLVATAINGSNDYRVQVYAKGTTKPFATSEVQSLKVKKAFMPESCPTEAIASNWGETGNLFQTGYKVTATYMDCSISYYDSLYPMVIKYKAMSLAQFNKEKKRNHGKTTKVGMNETAAYIIPGIYIPNSDAGTSDTYAIYFHGIELFTEVTGDQNFRTQINAIVVK